MKNEMIIVAIDTINARITSLEKHFTNHVSQHIIDKVIRFIELFIIIGMFCFLKWGLVKVPNQNKIENNNKNYIKQVEKNKVNKVEYRRNV